jgi:glycosyltransferase involved in cell wall biosynthesis
LLKERCFNVVFLRRWKFCFLLRLRFPRVPMVFDVRSGSIESSVMRRVVEDSLTWLNSLFFRHVTVISEGLGKRLRLPRRPHVLPLGADPSPVLTRRRQAVLRLVYIGTFKGRHLERTLTGLRRFLDETTRIDCRYTIIGFGPEEDVRAIQSAIAEHDLAEVVDLRERIAHNEVTRVLAEHDVGVAFTPLVPWFEHQPSTKVFEYLAAGLLCVATNTAANREAIDSRNGILIDDTVEGFCDGLRWVVNQLPNSDPGVVADTIRDRWWSTIVDSNLAPFLEQVAR